VSYCAPPANNFHWASLCWVDDFKRFNSTYGHAAGDAILHKIGDLLLGHVRGEDIPSRYGGDEFIIILPDATREVARERAERLCEHARHFNLQFEEQTLEAITLSFGVCLFPEDGSTSKTILKAADTALYRAKHERSAQTNGTHHLPPSGHSVFESVKSVSSDSMKEFDHE
jgi:diguanylate cyclase (GGDEF)-like protein